MKLRFARHTDNLEKIEKFYTEILGLTKVGAFENHDNYNGIFLAYQNSDWELEFTTSNEQKQSQFDEDDILVFYLNSEIEIAEIRKKIQKNNISLETPQNPYWQKNGFMISDPDAYKIVFARQDIKLNFVDELSKIIQNEGITTWSELIEFTRLLPYGRNQNREDFSLVLKEKKGTCSSKHSMLKKVADLYNISGVKLIMGIYKMNQLNTSKIGKIIIENGLEYIPEAHCYLKINEQRYDITSINSDIEKISNDLMYEEEILPEQVNSYKVDIHREFLQKWIVESKCQLSFEEVWNIREKCIIKLSE